MGLKHKSGGETVINGYVAFFYVLNFNRYFNLLERDAHLSEMWRIM